MYALIGIIAVGLSLLIGVASYKYLDLDEDNPIEDTAEGVIYHYRVLDVDSSPFDEAQDTPRSPEVPAREEIKPPPTPKLPRKKPSNQKKSQYNKDKSKD